MHALRHRAGHERRERLVPHRLAVEMAGQVHGRIPAAGNRERVAFDLHRAAVGIDHVDRPHIGLPWTCDTRAPVMTLTPSAENCPAGSRRAVDHGGDLEAGGARVGRGAPAVVIVGEHREPPAGRGRVAVDVAARRARQHHAGAVIVAERDHALERARGEHGALRDDLPRALARLMRRRHGEMIAHALDRAVLAVIEHAGDRGAAHDAAPRAARRARPRLAATHSVPGLASISYRSASSRPPSRESSSARITRAPARAGRERRRQAGRPAADHQHVAMREGLLVVVRILGAGGAAEPRGAADQRLVERFPELRPAT